MRFVKRRRDSLRRGYEYWSSTYYTPTLRTSYRLLHVVGSMLALLVLLSIVSILVVVPVLSPLFIGIRRVDPAIYDDLVEGRPVTVYVSYKGYLDMKCSRQWFFGEVKICKTVLHSLDELNKLLSKNSVLSIYGAKTIRSPPLHYLSIESYNFTEIDIDNVFHRVTGLWCGRNITVAVIDTGIDYTHPDFFDADGRSIIRILVSVLYVWANTSEYVAWDLEENPNITELLEFDKSVWLQYGEPAFLDINGHGTHVAGIIAGRGWASHGKYMGIAPCTKLVVIKAFNREGIASLDTVLEALEWVYNYSENYSIKILSISWGATFASDGNDPLSLACERIYLDRHVWIFASAGNEGNFPTTIVVPAVAEHVVAVGAWDAYHDKLAPFSSLGTTVDGRMKPDFVASGVMVVSTASQYARFPREYMVGKYYVALSGTSMSAPVVAGIACNFIEYYRYWYGREPSLKDFIEWEKENGRRVNPLFKDFITGYGIPISP